MDNVVEDKSFALSVKVVNLYKFICEEKKEYILSKQMLRCGTSIGANVVEAEQAQSRADFVSKMNIALKEAAELKYWLRLLLATNYLSENAFQSIFADAIEVEKILTAIIKTARQ